jgi:hypothetical protein
MAITDLLLRFRRDSNYEWDDLMRDLVEYNLEVAERFEDMEAQIAALQPRGGVWTPTLGFSATVTGLAQTSSGSWSRSGNIVYADFTITLTAKGTTPSPATAQAFITNLPFSVAAGTRITGVLSYVTGMAYNAGNIGTIARGPGGALGNINLTQTSGNSSGGAFHSHFTDTANLFGSIVYTTANP